MSFFLFFGGVCNGMELHISVVHVHFRGVLLLTCFASVQRPKTLRIFIVFCLAIVKILL